jgi:hypothetical protein
VLGLTNYSHWQGASQLRSCMLKDAAIGQELLDFALKRIEKFTHVGATDKLFESVESAAASLNMPLDGPAYGAGEVCAVCGLAAGALLTYEVVALKLGGLIACTLTEGAVCFIMCYL